MDPSPEQIAAFGAEARRRRKELGYTASAVAEQIAVKLGARVAHQDVTAWERGQYGPGSRAKAEALDEVLEAGGELAGLLAAPDGLNDRLTALEDQMAEVLRLLKRMGTKPNGRGAG